MPNPDACFGAKVYIEGLGLAVFEGGERGTLKYLEHPSLQEGYMPSLFDIKA